MAESDAVVGAALLVGCTPPPEDIGAAIEAVEHGVTLARIALAGPDPHIAATYLLDAIEEARRTLASIP